jgi:hypothetical protein
MIADSPLVGEHRRSFERRQALFDYWNFVPALATKPLEIHDSGT